MKNGRRAGGGGSRWLVVRRRRGGDDEEKRRRRDEKKRVNRGTQEVQKSQTFFLHPAWTKKEAEKKVKQLEEIAKTKLKDQIAKRQVLAEGKIDQLTRDANNEIQSHISSTAIAATITILEQKLNNKEQQNLIDQSINEIGTALKN